MTKFTNFTNFKNFLSFKNIPIVFKNYTIINLKTYINYIFIKRFDFLHDPTLINKGILLYRLCLILIAVYCFLINNPVIFLDILNTFSCSYHFDFLEQNTSINWIEYINMLDQSILEIDFKNFDKEALIMWVKGGHPVIDAWAQGLSAWTNTSGGGPSGGGPSGGGPIGLPVGPNDDHREKFDDYPYVLRPPFRKVTMHRPLFYWTEVFMGARIRHHIEIYHHVKPELFFHNTARIYEEDGLRYVYHLEYFYRENRHAHVSYPDNTRAIIYDKKTLFENIKYHRKHIAMNNRVTPYFDYVKLYQEHFKPFRQKYIDAIMTHTPIVSRGRISIDDLLIKDNDNISINDNTIQQNNVSNTQEIAKNKQIMSIDNIVNNEIIDKNKQIMSIDSIVNNETIDKNRQIMSVDNIVNNHKDNTTKQINVKDLLN